MAIPFLSNISGKNATFAGDVISTDGTDTATLSETGLTLSRSNSYIQSNADNSDTLNIGQSSVRWGHVKVDGADFAVLNGGNERFKIDSSGNATFAGDIIATHAGTPMVKLIDTTNDLQARFRVANSYAYLSVDNPNNVGSSRLVFQVDGAEALHLNASQKATFAGSIESNSITIDSHAPGNAVLTLQYDSNQDSPATVDNNDILGAIHFKGIDDSASNAVTGVYGKILATSDGLWDGSGNRGIDLSFHTGKYSGGSVSTAAALTLDQDQNATFAGDLNLADTKPIKWGNGNQQILGNNTDGLSLYSNGERIRILTNGNVGIGTTNPGQKLHISGSANGNVKALIENTSTGTSAYATLGFQSNQNHSVQPALFLNGSNNTNYAGANSLNMYQHGNFPLGFVTSNLIRMTVAGDGKVGIGTNAPAVKLHVEGGDSYTPIRFDGFGNYQGYLYNDGGGIGFKDSSGTNIGNLIYIHTAANNIRLFTNGSEKMRIDSSGNVGIGTTNPAQKLDVLGNVRSTHDANNYMQLESNSGGGVLSGKSSGTVTTLVRTYGNSYFNGGNFGIGTSSPTQKLDVRKNQAGYTYIASDNANTAASGTGSGFAMTEAGTVAWYLRSERDGSGKFNIGNSANRLTIDPSGNATFAGNVDYKPYPMPSTGSTAGWYKVGTLSSFPQNGNVAVIEMEGHAGYNAANNQDFCIKIYFKTSNGNGGGPNNQNFNSWYERTGLNSSHIEIVWKTSATNVYDLYMYLPVHTLGGFYKVRRRVGAWTHSAASASDPGANSSTILEAVHIFNVDGDLTVSGTSSTFNTGNSGTFITSDSSNYPRFTMTSASAQIGLFRAGSNAGGMYIGGAGDGFRLYTSSFSQKLFIDTNGNATFAGQIDVNGAVSSFGAAGTGTGDAIVSIDGGSGTGGEAYLRLTRGGTSGFILNHTASNIQVRATANIPMYFYTNDTVALTLSASQAATFAGQITATQNQITTNIGTTSAIRLKPGSTTNTTGKSSIFLGTSPVDNYGISLRGARLGTDGTPTFELATHFNSANGTVALSIDNSQNATFAGNVDFSNNKGLTWAGSHSVRVESNILKMAASGGIQLQNDTTFTGRILSSYAGTSYHTLQNSTNNGTILVLTSTGDSRTLTLQSDHIFSNGAFYLGNNSYATNFRGSSYNFESGNATFAGNVTVTGNLTVNGTTTTLNTQTVEVEDNILQLNTTQGSPDTATAATSGISVYRGDGVTQASLIFDDADDTWDLTNNLTVSNNIRLNNTKNLEFIGNSGDHARIFYTQGDGTTGDIWSHAFYQNSSFQAGIEFFASTEAAGNGNIRFKSGGAEALTLNASQLASFSGDVDVSGNKITMDTIMLQDAAGGRLGFNRDTSNGNIHDSSYNAYQIQNNTGASQGGKLEIQEYNSSGAYAGSTFITGNNLYLNDYVVHNGDDSKIGFEGNDAIRMYTANTVQLQISNNKVGIGTTSPTYKLSVNGAISGAGFVTYTKSYGSLNTTGNAVAGITSGGNGNSAGFTFTCFGGGGTYQRVVYSCFNESGTWRSRKVIDEGTNNLDVAASADGSTITFTFKATSSTQYYTPRVTVEATGHSINSTYA